jgi:hypothetical protein
MGEEGRCLIHILAQRLTRLNEIFMVCVAYDCNPCIYAFNTYWFRMECCVEF